MKFEVGKLYYNNTYSNTPILKCLFVTPKGYPVFVDTNTGTNEFIGFNKGMYEEFREPVKRWFNKYRIKETNEIFLAGNGWMGDSTKRLCGYDTRKYAEDAVIPLQDKYEYLGPVEIEF